MMTIRGSRGATTCRCGAGFTMLELIMAMAVFSVLGAAVVVLMRQSMSIFTTATRDTALQDRMDTMFPQVERDLQLLSLPASFDPPPPRPTDEQRLNGVEWQAPPPVDVRVRAGTVQLSDAAAEGLKEPVCPYLAWVVDVSEMRGDRLLRQAGSRTGPDAQEIVTRPDEEITDLTVLKPSGGLREVCYVAVPEDPAFPALLTLYYGWRSPIGGEASLLDPLNLDTLTEIRERCQPIEKGVLHFSATWRRVFATTWELTPGGKLDETDPYVGFVWDSTRALEKTFPLYVGPESLGDPSDDVFPAWVRVEVSLVAPGARGYGRGVSFLRQPIDDDDRLIVVDDAAPLLGPGPPERWLKIDGEWMRYRPAKVDLGTREVAVDRGLRGTTARSHDMDAEVYVGLESSRDIRLLYRDRYAKRSGGP